jgi:hypothetical protein
MMIRAYRFAGQAPIGTIVVRIVRAGDRIEGFILDIEEPRSDEPVYPSEQKPMDQVWRLVENKLADMPGARVLVEMEAGVDWDPAWGEIRG